MSFTPGPWSCSHITGNGLGGSYDHHEIRVNGNTFCTIYGDRSDQAKANARLIAAAPELLEALEAIIEDIDSEFGTDYEYANARTVIAKARGEGA